MWQKVDFFWLLLLLGCTGPNALLDCATTTISHFIIGTIVVIVIIFITIKLHKLLHYVVEVEQGLVQAGRLPNWGILVLSVLLHNMVEVEG